MTNSPEYLYTCREICKECKIGYATLQEMIKAGAPVGIRMGRSGRKKYRADKKELLAWTASSQLSATETEEETTT